MGSKSDHVKNFRELLQDRVMKRLEAKADYGKRSSPNRELNETSTVANLSQVTKPSPKRSLLTNEIWDRVGERVAAKNNLLSRTCNNQSPTVGDVLESSAGKIPGVSNSTDDIKARIRAMSKVIGFASQIQDNISKHATDRAAQIVRKVSCEVKEKRHSETRVPEIRRLSETRVPERYSETEKTDQLLDLSQFGMRNLLQEASSVYEETLSQGRFMEDDYFSLPSVASTQSLFSNISEYRAFNKYLHSQSNILTDISLVDGEVTEGPVGELSEDMLINYFQQLREVLDQEERDACPTPTPDTPSFLPDTPSCTTPSCATPTPSTPPDSGLAITPTPTYDDITPLQSPHQSPRPFLSDEGAPHYPQNSTRSPPRRSPGRHSVMVDSACQYSDDDASCDAECQTELNQTENEQMSSQTDQTSDHSDQDSRDESYVDNVQISGQDMPASTQTSNHISIQTEGEVRQVYNHSATVTTDNQSNHSIQTERVDQTSQNGPQNLLDCCVQTQTTANQTGAVTNQTQTAVIDQNQSDCTEHDVEILPVDDCLTTALSKCKSAVSPPKTENQEPSNITPVEIPSRPLSLKQQMLRNLSSPSPHQNTKLPPYHTPSKQSKHPVIPLSESGKFQTGLLTPDHSFKKVHQDDMNSSVYDVRVDSSSAQVINIADEGASNIKVLVNLFSDTAPQTLVAEKAGCQHKGHNHSGVLTCESVPTFNEGELEQLFSECHNETMKELYSELDHEFLSTTEQRDASQHEMRQDSVIRGDISRDSDNVSCSDSDTLSAGSVLNCSPPITEKYVNQTQSKPPAPLLNLLQSTKPPFQALNQPKTRVFNQSRCQIKHSSQNQTLSLPFRLIKFLPVEPDSFLNRKFAHDGISNDNISSMCKGVQVNFERHPSLTNQEELYILDRETQLEAQRITLLQQHRYHQVT